MIDVKSLSDFGSRRGGAALKARLRHIDDRLLWFGFFRLSDHVETFQISEVQGKIDLQTYRGLSQTPPPDRKVGRPGAGGRPALQRPGIYERPEHFVPVFPGPRNLDDLLATRLPESTPRTSFLIERIDALPRVIEPDRVRAVLAAAELGQCCLIDYQSLTSTSRSSRVISPHALVKASSRWHMRAFDFARNRFVDFALSRVKTSTQESTKLAVPPDIDADWHALLNIEIIPNPNLSLTQRETVAREFEMQDGRTVRQIRKALVFYLLDELRLLREGTLPELPPAESPLWIANSGELVGNLNSMRF
jgi:WYL domain